MKFYRFRSRVSLVTFFMEQKEAENINYLKENVKLDPNSHVKWSMLGEAYYKNRKLKKALSCFNKAVKLKDDYLLAIENVAKINCELERYDKARIYIRNIVIINPESLLAYSLLGRVYRKTGNYLDAIKAYKKAITLNPDDETCGGFWNNLGVVYNTIGETGLAINSYAQALRLYTDTSTVYFNIARVYHADGSFSKAIKYYKKSIGKNPNHQKALYYLGKLYISRNQFFEALDVLNVLERLSPNYDGIYFEKGLISLNLNEIDESIGFFRRAIRQQPERADAWCQLGVSYSKQKKFKMAAACLNKVIQIKNNDGRYYTELATLYSSKLGIPDKAETYFRKACEVEKENTEYQWNLAYFYQEQGKLNDLIHTLLDLNKIDENEDVYDLLSWSYFELEDYQLSIKCSEKFVEISNRPIKIFMHKFYISHALLLSGEAEKAIAAYVFVLEQVDDVRYIDKFGIEPLKINFSEKIEEDDYKRAMDVLYDAKTRLEK